MTSSGYGAAYSIKAVSRATGLTVETLRAWERRYRVVAPRRAAGGHRLYSAVDVERLRRLQEVTRLGHPIGKIAQLANADLDRLLAERDGDRPQVDGARALVERILASIEKYRPDDCDQAVAMAFALLPVPDVIRQVLSPALREVGDRWHRGDFTIAQEHMVSSSIRRRIGALLNTYNGMARGAGVVFATLGGEQHELGILMFAALAASRSLRVFYLGPDLPPEEIAEYARRVGAAAVAVSLVMPRSIRESLRQLETLRDGLPPEVELWIGGAACGGVDPGEFPAGSVLMSGCADFETRINLLAAPAPHR